MTGQGFVDGVVDHLVDHVMQARAVVGVADVHAGALADRVQPLQHADRFRTVFALTMFVQNRGGTLGLTRERTLGRDRGVVAHSVLSMPDLAIGVRTPPVSGDASTLMTSAASKESNSDRSVPVRKTCSPSAAIS